MSQDQHQRWTQNHITDLRSGLRQGECAEAIAAALERTPDEVRAMMARLRLREQPLPGA